MGSASAGRDDKKGEKYSNLSDNYHFVPVGVETKGASNSATLCQVLKLPALVETYGA